MAEREGFEPSVEILSLRRFSKPLPSATRPPLHITINGLRRIHGGKRRQGGNHQRSGILPQPMGRAQERSDTWFSMGPRVSIADRFMNKSSHGLDITDVDWSFAPAPSLRRILQDAQKGCPARPQRAKRRRRTLRYVESLSDARTPLGDFFSILLRPA